MIDSAELRREIQITLLAAEIVTWGTFRGQSAYSAGIIDVARRWIDNPETRHQKENAKEAGQAAQAVMVKLQELKII